MRPRPWLVAAVAALVAAGSGASSRDTASPAARGESRYPCDSCLVQIGVDGRGERILLRDAPSIQDMSPDRRRILYVRYQKGLYTARVDGSDPRRLIETADSIGGGRFSPSGTLVAYHQQVQPPRPEEELPCGGSEVRVVNVDGTGVRRIEGCARRPAWAPDSRRVAYGAELQHLGAGVFATADVGGSVRRSLGIFEDEGNSFDSPLWSPRGDLLAYVTHTQLDPPGGHGSFTGGTFNTSATTELHLVRPDGTPLAVLARASAPAWSPDGKRLAFLRNGSLRVTTVGRGPVRTIKKYFDEQVAWSPDGRLLAFADDAGNISVLPPDGRRVRQVTRVPPGGSIDAFWWSRDSLRLYYSWTCNLEVEEGETPCADE